MRFIVLAETTPHIVTDGFNLRVKNVIERLSRVAAPEKIGLICPTPADDVARLRDWAARHHITPLYQDRTNDRIGFEPPVVWDILSEIKHIHPHACIIIMGVFAIMKFHAIAKEMSVIADLIDEESPHFTKRIRMFERSDRTGDAQFMRSLYRDYLAAMKGLGACRKILLISHDEAARFAEISHMDSDIIEVSPNGVALPERITSQEHSGYLIFHGTLNYYPNEDAALFLIHKLAPLLYRKFPELRVVIAGRYPTEKLLRELPATKNVILYSDVADIGYYLRRSIAAVVPLFARTGIQNKVLEAWACGIPVIATSSIYDVFHKFSAEVRNCMLRSESARQMLRQISMLVRDPALRKEMGMQGRLYVENNFSWDVTVRRIYEICAGQRAAHEKVRV
ncbi:MAG: glycosyltransferase family 4 protein [Candidatus Aureabacteria bacterium]|nr:glycosyltransferase family 4 protein [Candidatus Auribacterota bacterium]